MSDKHERQRRLEADRERRRKLREVPDLAAFLRARLDEDEAAANAGARRTGMPWRAEPQPGTPGGLVIDDLGLVGSTGGRYAAEHIARHDPARVLREVEVKRAILARHQAYPLDRWQMCSACCSVEHFEFTGAELSAVRWPCPDVRQLATVYSDHPDYQQEWKP